MSMKTALNSSDGESFEIEEAIEHQSSTITHSSFTTSPREFFLSYELFTSKTLVKLTLETRITIGELPQAVFLRVLKTLAIDIVYF
ncbi:unnamed protein product [Arabis nemorensis]|uniref:SKP1 component POZ domain-containing protein n=1 Tax=Arabis nemorensis TaxID=586526 RepID=A0A565CGE1_9BRAS|nr:unnamed protein product [Arabis nemorensis]